MEVRLASNKPHNMHVYEKETTAGGLGLAQGRREYGQDLEARDLGGGFGEGGGYCSEKNGDRTAKEGRRRFEDDDIFVSSFEFVDVPFEFVGKVASAGAMAEACDIEGSPTSSRHVVPSVRA